VEKVNKMIPIPISHNKIIAMTSRTDCESFELKQNENQNGDCQSDGHFLCSNCKHIATFEDLDLVDNKMRYYPEKLKEQEQVSTITTTTKNKYGKFRTLREAKRFSKIYALLQIMNSQVGGDNEETSIVTDLQCDWAHKELCKMNLPDGFSKLGTFDGALQWFLQNCHNR
jgi:hypothetical protein